MRVALINGTEIFYLAGHPVLTERTYSAFDVRISGRVSVQVRARLRAAEVEHIDRGNVTTALEFSTTRQFGTPAAAEGYAGLLGSIASLDGLLVLIADSAGSPAGCVYLAGAVVELIASELHGCSVTLHYRAEGGVFSSHPAATYAPAPWVPKLFTRISAATGSHGAEKWFDVGFDSPELFSGSAAAGWAGVASTLEMLWSNDLKVWLGGQFSDCSGSPSANGDGTWRYWMRAVFPEDSAASTAVLNVTSSAGTWGDSRNNPITALTLNGAAQSLAHFPYTLPGDAAQLQTDLRALGWTGATVSASTDVDWAITIPDVSLTTFTALNKVFWPVYYVADIIFSVFWPVNGYVFSGQYLNGGGVQTKMPQQFARLKLASL